MIRCTTGAVSLLPVRHPGISAPSRIPCGRHPRFNGRAEHSEGTE